MLLNGTLIFGLFFFPELGIAGAALSPVILIINLDEVVKVPAAVVHYKKYGWLRNITRDQEAALTYETRECES